MRRKHHLRQKIVLHKFFEYGFHLWILLLLANILVLYQFHFFTRAAENDTTADKIAALLTPAAAAGVTVNPNLYNPTATPTNTPTPTVTPTPIPPLGPVIGLTFSIPGIGSGGGTMQPLHPVRNLTIYLYATDVNSNDNKVRPIFTLKTKATFDTNINSPTYTAFANHHIDLGDTVKNGEYQIAYTTDQSMRNLVKSKDNAIGGKIVKIHRDQFIDLPLQKTIMGDMSPPEGNNVLDINDYNLFVACYGKYPNCLGAKQVDLNDDGALDGIDYNVMALGFKAMVALGVPPPQLPTVVPTQVSKLSQLSVTPKAKPTSKPSLKVSPSAAATANVKSSGSSPLGGILLFFFFLFILGGGAFVLLKTKFGKNLLAKLPLPKKTPPAETPPAETPPAETPPAPDAVAPAESTEISLEELAAAKSTAPAGDTPPQAAPAATPGAVDKTYYVKNKTKDTKGTWVVLTDDSGPIDGLYSGDIEDGFEHLKGTMVEENGKKYLKITEVLPSEG
jgi:hypothetical protein